MIHPGENLHVVCDHVDCGQSIDLSAPWVVSARTLGGALDYARSEGWTSTPVPVRYLCPSHEGAGRAKIVRAGV